MYLDSNEVEDLNKIPMGESPEQNFNETEEQMSSSIINEDCGCVAEEVTYTYSKFCWVTVSTSCVEGMVTTIEQTCCQKGDCGNDRVPFLGRSCKDVCEEYHIPYKPRK